MAVLLYGVEDLERMLNIRFVEGSDELSAFRAAGLTLPSGRQVLLLRRDYPDQEVAVWADGNDDGSAAVAELLVATALEENRLIPLPPAPL